MTSPLLLCPVSPSTLSSELQCYVAEDNASFRAERADYDAQKVKIAAAKHVSSEVIAGYYLLHHLCSAIALLCIHRFTGRTKMQRTRLVVL